MKRNRAIKKLSWSLTLAAALLMGAVGSAVADPVLKVNAITPDFVTPGRGVMVPLPVQNVGDQPLDGILTIRTVFPGGVTPTDWVNDSFNVPDPQCSTAGQESTCTIDVTGLLPGVQMRVRLSAAVDANASGPLSPGSVEVSGGGTTDDVTTPLSLVASPTAPFAVRGFDVDLSPTAARRSVRACRRRPDGRDDAGQIGLPGESVLRLARPVLSRHRAVREPSRRHRARAAGLRGQPHGDGRPLRIRRS